MLRSSLRSPHPAWLQPLAFEAATSIPPSFCPSLLTVGMWQWHFWAGDVPPEICEAKAEEAFLESLPIACSPGLYSPCPFSHKSSLRCRELSAATLCKALRCLQPSRHHWPFPSKGGEEGLAGEACVVFAPFSLSAGTFLPQISL